MTTLKDALAFLSLPYHAAFLALRGRAVDRLLLTGAALSTIAQAGLALCLFMAWRELRA